MKTESYPQFPVEIIRTTLDNGLAVITIGGKTPHPLAQVSLAFRSGGNADGRKGTAHLLEHLLLQGPMRTGIHPTLETLVPRGVISNGETGELSTSYWLKGLQEDWPDLVSALFRICFTLATTEDAFQAEKKIVQAETTQRLAQSAFQRLEIEPRLFPDESDRLRSVHGTTKTLQTLTREALAAFHAAHYVPDNAAIIIAGNIMSHEEAVEHVRRQPMPGPGGFKKFPPRIVGSIPPRPGRHEIRSPLVTKGKESIGIVFPAPGEDPLSLANRKDRSLCAIARDLLDSSPFGIIYHLARVKEQSAYSVGAMLKRIGECRFQSVEILTAPSRMARIEETIWTGVGKLITADYPRIALDTVKKRDEIEQMINDAKPPIAWLPAIVDRWVNEDWFRCPSIGRDATPEDIAEVASRYFDREKAAVITVLPQD